MICTQAWNLKSATQVICRMYRLFVAVFENGTQGTRERKLFLTIYIFYEGWRRYSLVWTRMEPKQIFFSHKAKRLHEFNNFDNFLNNTKC